MFLPFNYYDPKTLEEFMTMVSEHPDFQIMAGGTDLLVRMRNGYSPCSCVIDIKKIQNLPELTEIKADVDGIHLGSLVTFNEIKENPIIQQKFSVLYEASCLMGCLEIRNRATIGGNICTASSCAEGGSALLALDTIVNIAGKEGRRQVPLSQFYCMVTGDDGREKASVALKKGELLTSFFIPFLPDPISTYVRRARNKGMDLASLNLAMVVSNKSDIPKMQFRIAAGAVSPLPRRFPEVEQIMSGKDVFKEVLSEASKKISELASPRASSKRASPEYKKEQIGLLLEEAWHKLEKQMEKNE